MLRQELADHLVEGPAERYRLDWPGKRESAFAANAPEAITLRPVREESVDFDTTQNLFIEGDNLQALKLLQDSYLGKAKLIYIDPPYNTGNDFIYDDDFAESTGEYLERSGQVDEAGGRLVANTESNGRFHSDWLSMMYPRLKLARNLLSDDGVIFISVNDLELGGLRILCDEVFGIENRLAFIAWQNLDTVKNDARHFSGNHEYLLSYGRDLGKVVIPGILKGDKQRSTYKNRDSDPRGDYLLTPLHAKSGSDSGRYTFTFANGQEWTPPPGTFPRFSRETLARLEAEGRLYLDPDGRSTPQRKTYWAEVGDRMRPTTFWSFEQFGSTRQSNAEVSELMGKGIFQNPKPSRLLVAILDLMGVNEGVVLDFFAGSSTTAHAVMAANAEDGGNRRFVMVQLAEPMPEDSAAREAGFDDIAQLSRERIRRAGAKIKDEAGLTADSLDVGFRTLRVDSTNYSDVRLTPDETSQATLDMLVDNIKADRTPEDLLFEVILDWGLELSLPIERAQVEGAEVFLVEGNFLIGCFDHEVSDAVIRSIAERKPTYAVFRDSTFASDDAQINAKQIFTEVSPDTQLKVI